MAVRDHLMCALGTFEGLRPWNRRPSKSREQSEKGGRKAKKETCVHAAQGRKRTQHRRIRKEMMCEASVEGLALRGAEMRVAALRAGRTLKIAQLDFSHQTGVLNMHLKERARI